MKNDMNYFLHSFRQWLFGLERKDKKVIQITFDSLAVLTTFMSAFYLRLETFEYFYNRDTYVGVAIAIVSIVGVFTVRGFYNNFTRYLSIEATYNIAIGSAVTCAVLFSGILLLGLQIPRSVPIIFAGFFAVSALGVRLFVRALIQNLGKHKKERVAIFGTGAASIQLLEVVRQNQDYQVCLFVDDSIKLDGKHLHGIPVAALQSAKNKFEQLSIQTLFLAIPNDNVKVKEIIFNNLPDHPLKIKIIPNISDLISGWSSITDLKDIKVEDVLGREPVRFDNSLMSKNVTGKTVLVSGAGGSIGSELCRQIIIWKPKRLVLLDVSEFAIYSILEELKKSVAGEIRDISPVIGSVQDRHFVKTVFDTFSVDTIYHAAAYKHVPLMELNVMQCVENNVFGTLNMAELAISADVESFTLVSTDKAVNPTNYMGASKRIAEIICQSLTTQNKKTCFTVVRFGNVLGSSGSVVPLFKEQISMGGPITVTHPKITRFFMTIKEAAQLVIQAGAISRGGEVFVLDMGEPIKIIELAKKMITLSGLNPVIHKDKTLNDNDIRIIISGLRPGEKLFEELSYTSKLVDTMHPRIKTADETSMCYIKVQILLEGLRKALDEKNYQSLYQHMSSVAGGISVIANSNDQFIFSDTSPPAKVIPMRHPANK